MKKLLFIFFITLFTTLVQAQVSRIINLETAGTLSTLLTDNEKATITELIISGSINAKDVKCIRDEITMLKNLDLSEVTIQAYYGSSGTYTTYPISSRNYPANEIPTNSFVKYGDAGKTSLSSVKLPNNITSIGSAAFNNCTGLLSVLIPNSVISINTSAFSNCTGLTSIDIPNSVTGIGRGAFEYCSGLTNLVIPNSIDAIYETTFSNCTGLKTLTIPSTIRSIGNNAFINCNSITILNIPTGVTTIGSNAFENCTSITALTLSVGLSNIGEAAFKNCSGLKTIYCLSDTPPTLYSYYILGQSPPVLYSYCFDGANSVTDVYVLTDAAVNAYKANSNWYLFFPENIIKKDITSVVSSQKNRHIKVYSTNSEIRIQGTSEGETVTLYTVNGKHIQTIMSKGERLNLSVDRNTIYLVKTGEKIFKVIL